jgi:hypothetical protein
VAFTIYDKIMLEVIKIITSKWLYNVGQGEAQHNKCKRLKFGGGQTCDRSTD